MKKIMFNDRYGLTEAVIIGLKTQARRLMKNQSGNPVAQIKFTKKGSSLVYVLAYFDNGISEDCPYAIGEIVAVAQSYYAIMNSGVKIPYKFDVSMTSHKGWTNKIFVCADLMPHQIRILDVRAEWLQDITDEDMEEGIIEHPYGGYMVEGIVHARCKDTDYNGSLRIFDTPREAFASFFDKIIYKGAFNDNPFVWRIEFELVK